MNLNDKVIETSIGNIFWVKNDRIFTPDLSFSGVEGVMKKHIEYLSKKYQLKISELSVNLSTLENADEVFITNALFEIVPINKIASIEFTQHRLANWFQEKLYSC